MFFISYDTWKEICNMYFSLSSGSKKSYLQWFPLSKLSKNDEKTISSLDFYEKYIEKGSFILFERSSNVTENYILKPDGSFRDATLIDPVLYLVLQCIGREINKKYNSLRQSNILVHYAGNYDNSDCKYKAEYDTFFKEINASATENSYFIKTDIRNFFSNINVDKLMRQIDKVISFISLDPKRLTVLILKTRDEEAIKSLLNQLFSRNRNDVWNAYDTSIAITYLIQRQFQHPDLLLILKNKSPLLYSYYENNCQQSFIDIFEDDEMTEFCDILDIDQKAQFLYFMYLCERQKNNIMAAYAYYKNFFDRMTADLDFKYVSKLKKPNYKGFYKEGAIKTFYKNITDSDLIIKTAHDLRNANPLSHSSSELLDHTNTTKELLDTICKLREIINEYIEKGNDNQI